MRMFSRNITEWNTYEYNLDIICKLYGMAPTVYGYVEQVFGDGQYLYSENVWWAGDAR